MNVADEGCVLRLVELAKAEDLGGGDLSTTLIANPAQQAAFNLIAKQQGVLAGCEVAPVVLRTYDESILLGWTDKGSDGAKVDAACGPLATIHGSVGVILSAERVLLNFLQRLSGVATLTRAYVDAVAGTVAAIYDTRKTTPGWRTLEKYAVRCGGGRNHRQGLFDAVLIKDNHLAGVPRERLAGTVFDMLNRISVSGAKPSFVEVEADTLDQVEELFKVVGIDVILLDNFPLEDMVRAVDMRDAHGLRGKVELEASGGITLATIGAVAATGVERISVGAITHSAVALDLSLERVAC